MTDAEVVQVIVHSAPDVEVRVDGLSGSAPSDFAYHHIQGASSDLWEIGHGLGFYPNVTVMDSAGSTVEGELEHISQYRLRLTFSAPISGNAYLS